ncbi:hypothetical protein PGT21_032771 [Puccinia graminis f. sp. tritici]|uniref:Uncharacterized protein n=1 Tax=Puccinia graminis f. sp. tritici TaxID=56615 RepID=A0A5B0QJY5_PUCGR|nr:hypothetical protein PGT21_032771 [Puccinia graminis f. sp. tritici]
MGNNQICSQTAEESIFFPCYRWRPMCNPNMTFPTRSLSLQAYQGSESIIRHDGPTFDSSQLELTASPSGLLTPLWDVTDEICDPP